MSRVLVIGLDGGTFDLILPLVQRGQMPFLAGLLDEGSWGRLASTVPPFTATAWSTFATGHDPGRHGILSFQWAERFDYYTNSLGFVDARRLKRPLWHWLSQAGKRVAVINVPLTYPPRQVNGVMVTGMMTPADSTEFTYPPELAAELDAYRIDVNFIREGDSFRRYGLPPKEEMLADIRDVTQKRTAVCEHLLQQESWDFFMVVFTGTDRVNHFFWDDLEPLWGKRPFPDTPSPLLTSLLAYFQELDASIEKLVTAVGPDTHILLMSDHGFGTSPTKRFNVNLWLEQQGLLTARQTANPFSLAFWRMKVGRVPWLKRLARRIMSQEMQDNLTDKAKAGGKNSDIVWKKTQAFFVPIYFNVGGIEINTVGEHREGIVHTGQAYETIRTKIIETLQQMRDPQTGQPIVERVARREEIFSGPYVAQFPDIILVLKPEYVGAGSVAGGELIERFAPFRSGEHRSDGIFVARGPQITARADIPGLRLVDVPPTILYLMGQPIPNDFDGRILQEIFTPAYWAENPPTYQDVTDEDDIMLETATYSEAEEAEVAKHLRSLGYLE